MKKGRNISATVPIAYMERIHIDHTQNIIGMQSYLFPAGSKDAVLMFHLVVEAEVIALVTTSKSSICGSKE
jgi:hypothetical protein